MFAYLIRILSMLRAWTKNQNVSIANLINIMLNTQTHVRVTDFLDFFVTQMR